MGRLGEVKYKINFPPEYLSKLEKNPGIVKISNFLQRVNSSDFPFISVGVGVLDNQEKYRGFVNARIDLNALREILAPKQGSGLQFILLDAVGQEVLSSLPGEGTFSENLGMWGYFKDILEGNRSLPQYVFPLQFTVKEFPYVFRFGYDQNHLYLSFLKDSYLSFILVFSCLFLFSLFAHFYHKRFIKKALRHFKKNNREKNFKIDQVTEENQRLREREKTLEKSIKSFEEADKEEKKFCLEINKRISQSLSQMLDIANFLLNRIQEENKIEEDPKELMAAFENTYTHSRFFTLSYEEELVSINDILEEVLVVFSKQIFKKELIIQYPKQKVIALLTDRTALKQALINILGIAMKNSPKKGEICLTLSSYEEGVCLECRDNGYLGENSLKEPDASEEKSFSLDCMSLEKGDMQKLIKSLGGTLSAFYKPYKGNTFLLQIPYQIRKNKQRTAENSDNIVPFSGVRKKV
ncbi:MAG: sensor histidine kinase [Alphaproteobacteria bacterium]|nr:sensor histidine kinase [Alphaproteobacteria bacterium]